MQEELGFDYCKGLCLSCPPTCDQSSFATPLSESIFIGGNASARQAKTAGEEIQKYVDRMHEHIRAVVGDLEGHTHRLRFFDWFISACTVKCRSIWQLHFSSYCPMSLEGAVWTGGVGFPSANPRHPLAVGREVHTADLIRSIDTVFPSISLCHQSRHHECYGGAQ